MNKTIRFTFRGRVYRIDLWGGVELRSYPVYPPIQQAEPVKKKVRRERSRKSSAPSRSIYTWCGYAGCGKDLTEYAQEHYGGFCRKHYLNHHEITAKIVLNLPVTEPRYGPMVTDNLATGAP